MKSTISLRALGVLVGLVMLDGSRSHAAGTNLNPGDIAFTMFDTGGATVSTTVNRFSFVTFVDLTSNTTIYFTDIGWTGSAFRAAANGSSSETVLAYTTSGPVTKGTQITIGYDSNGNLSASTGGSVSAAFSSASSLVYSTAGDQLLAFQGSTFDATVTFVAGITSDTTNFQASTAWGSGAGSLPESALPSTLQPGKHALSVSSTGTPGSYVSTGASNSGTDTIYAQLNFAAVGALSSGGTSRTQDSWLNIINDPSNWTKSNTTSFTDNSNSFLISAIPEPSVYASLAGIIAMGLVLTARRKRS